MISFIIRTSNMHILFLFAVCEDVKKMKQAAKSSTWQSKEFKQAHISNQISQAIILLRHQKSHKSQAWLYRFALWRMYD